MIRSIDRIGWTVLALVSAAATLGTGSVLGQSPAPDDRALLLARCASNAADDVQLATCRWVVDVVLAPLPDPSAGPGGEMPGVGVTLRRGAEQVTVTHVEWDAAARTGRYPKDTANRLISVRLTVAATSDGAGYDPTGWSLVGRDGHAWAQSDGGLTPALGPGGELPVGTTAKGWLTFEVPKSLRVFTLIEGGDGGLRWHLTEPACRWVRLDRSRPRMRICPPATDTDPGPADVTDVPMPEPGSSAVPVAPGPPDSLPSKGTPSPNPSPAPSSQAPGS